MDKKTIVEQTIKDTQKLLKDIGTECLRYRQNSMKTIKDMSEEVFLSDEVIRRIECGEMIMSLQKIVRLLDKCGMELTIRYKGINEDSINTPATA